MLCCVYVHSYGHSGAGVVFTMNIRLKKSSLKYMLTKYKKMFELMLRTLKKYIEFEMIVQVLKLMK